MTQTAKLDITRADQRGLTLGLNEFAGYVGVALAGIITAYAASLLGPRLGLLIFGVIVVAAGIALALLWGRDTLPWAKAEAAAHSQPAVAGAFRPRYPSGVSDAPGTWEVFAVMSWRDRRLAAIAQAGLVEKFVDALVWVIFPVFLFAQGVSLPNIGWVVGVYGLVWGGSQLITGRLSDHVGRFWPNVLGMCTCGAGVALIGCGGRHHPARLAGFGDRHLPLLARSRLRNRRARPRHRGPCDRSHRGGILVRRHLDDAVWRRAVVVGRGIPSPAQPGSATRGRRFATKHLLVLNDPPYGTERSFNGLRMAHALPKDDSDGGVSPVEFERRNAQRGN